MTTVAVSDCHPPAMGRTGHKRSLEASSGEEPRHKVFPLKCIFVSVFVATLNNPFCEFSISENYFLFSHQTLRPSENTVAGTIVRVRLEHFMCHEELDW